ncbi:MULTISPECIES: hypothetical protein [unclassified Enterococcus]|uniref:hypothetical protein n=1 Tax=unclassified Enterococcus TaxID=2608891 RepID=UPI001CE22ADA|nr:MULTISPECIES: hypothetical protein [unclassified Enterococcus]MCA5012215.1 hypothetical protein [Enterococcus sp. S23]MCA5015466.1 hypothetical protein [Enterococcus sp. S22(2020)]
MKHSAVCIKMVPYQHILNLRDTLERLESWQEPLAVLECYFSHTQHPVNEKQIVKHYYACAELFQLFHSTYQELLEQANNSVENMTKQQTLKFSENQ